MQLRKALRIEPAMTVAFTGAGGKTSAIARLAAELSSSCPVLITTTTKFGSEQEQLAAFHLPLQVPEDLARVPQLLKEFPSVLVSGGQPGGSAKLEGVDLATAEILREYVMAAGGVLLVEADGARGCSLKAPASHEPVVPPLADLVVPVAAADALEAPIDSPRIHRPEIVARLLGLGAEDRLTPARIAALLAHPLGGMKGVPPGAAVRVLINKIDDQRLESARQIADSLLASAGPQAVVLGSVAREPAVREVNSRVAGIVLAAGGSQRLGEPKQLVVWRGKPLIAHAVEAGLAGGLDPLVVVLGAHAAEIRPVLEGYAVQIVDNPDWEAGQAASLRLGLQTIAAAEAALFLLADTPFVDGDLVRALVAEHRRSLAGVIAPTANGRRANPVLFDRAVFAELQALHGDQGGRGLFHRFPPQTIAWDPRIEHDLDTPADLHTLRRLE